MSSTGNSQQQGRSDLYIVISEDEPFEAGHAVHDRLGYGQAAGQASTKTNSVSFFPGKAP